MEKPFTLKTALRSSLNAIGRTALGVRLGAIIRLPENRYEQQLNRLESEILFQELLRPGAGLPPVLTRRRFAHWQAPGFLFSEQTAAAESSFDWNLIDNHDETVTLIRHLGRERFERFFLYEEQGLPLPYIAATCNLTQEQASDIRRFTEEVLTKSPGFIAAPGPGAHLPVKIIARIDKNNDGTLSLGVFSARYARGRYLINHEALAALRKNLPPHKRRTLERLIAAIELANKKQTALEALCLGLIETQKTFFLSGETEKLQALTQRQLARQSGVHPSVCCRLLNHRAVQTPQGQVVLLKDLAPGRGRLIRRKIAEFAAQTSNLTGRRMADRLAQAGFGPVTVRLVNHYRALLRKKHA
ncbi:MAG: hypothetical protein HYT79_11665 [Elusimicrobia bacterium]|nr:hypothetical protein [Elusimicrobiota bacterium]